MADMVRDDLMVGALGRRAATLEGVGDWRATGPELELEALTSAGLLGKSTSISPMFPNLMRMRYLGHVMRGGEKVRMQDFQLNRWFYIAPFNDAYSMLQVFQARNPNNWPGIVIPEFD